MPLMSSTNMHATSVRLAARGPLATNGPSAPVIMPAGERRREPSPVSSLTFPRAPATRRPAKTATSAANNASTAPR